MTDDEEQKALIDAAFQWTQILAAEIKYLNDPNKEDDSDLMIDMERNTLDLLRSARVLSAERYRRLLTAYVGDKIEARKRHEDLERDLADLVSSIQTRDFKNSQ